MGCSADVDCGLGAYCGGDHTCTADCLAGADDCPANERCDANGRCASITSPPPCQGTTPPAACGEDCTTDADCWPDAYCGSDGKCTADCSTDGDQCDSGTICTSSGRCTKPTGPDCPDVSVRLDPVIPSVMLLIDQSGSMDDAFGKIGGKSVTRWEAVRYALTDTTDGAVTSLQDRVRFAATLYHSKGGTAGGTCPILTQSAGTGQPVFNNRKPIDDLLANNKPVQDTPTAESVDGVVQQMKSWAAGGPDTQVGPKVLVLATDGDPDNCTDPNAHNATSPKMSETAVQKAHSAGIQTYVLSVGSDVSKTHLQHLANAGVGKPLTPADAPYYQGNDPAELVKAFDTIIHGVRTCVFVLDQSVQLQYAQSGAVVLDGKTLTFGVDWVLKDPRTIELRGQACTTFLAAQSGTLTATFPCGVVIS